MRTDYLRNRMYWKVVYYGAGLCGKTTNLIEVEKTIPPTHRDNLVLYETDEERTYYLDNLDFNLGKKGQFDIRVRLYTVPGQSHYAKTRREVLKDVDAVIFVADSQPEIFDSNIASKNELAKYLGEQNTELESIPYVLQLNKRDIPGALPTAQLTDALKIGKSPVVPAVAVQGLGIMSTLNEVLKLSVPIIHKKIEYIQKKRGLMPEKIG